MRQNFLQVSYFSDTACWSFSSSFEENLSFFNHTLSIVTTSLLHNITDQQVTDYTNVCFLAMKMSETMPFFVSTWMKVMAVAQIFLIGKEDFSLLLAISLPLGILLLPTTRHTTDTDLMALMCWQFLVLWCSFSMIQVSEQNNLAVSKLFTQLVFGETEQKGKWNRLLGKFGKNKRLFTAI